ncbi:ATP-binding protein [Mucilaginibacter mali]|uniref:ATP-binding protein n=1 Tax=Mucilaginibacter mali TaxID=2740462 RepID=A0A7D4Q7P0_9SPHI|nr:ATP-binding protein [Mucilaginibacter mali]QKJ28304.1 ATP-binding protein [Mucilaginibacter mali]
MEQAIRQILIFPNRADKIYTFIQKVVGFIEQYMPEKVSKVSFNIRVIVTELLTNSIKHTGGGDTGVELILTPTTFTIKKTDEGTPFDIKHDGAGWPLDEGIKGPIKIYSDVLNGLYANIVSPYSLSFYTESYADAGEDHADLSEHYGLIIICRASDSFVYQYNPRSRQNIFTVTINLV